MFFVISLFYCSSSFELIVTTSRRTNMIWLYLLYNDSVMSWTFCCVFVLSLPVSYCYFVVTLPVCSPYTLPLYFRSTPPSLCLPSRHCCLPHTCAPSAHQPSCFYTLWFSFSLFQLFLCCDLYNKVQSCFFLFPLCQVFLLRLMFQAMCECFLPLVTKSLAYL